MHYFLKYFFPLFSGFYASFIRPYIHISITHPCQFSKSRFNLKSDHVNLVAPASPIECLLYLPNVRAMQYKLGPERLTRLGNSNALRLPVPCIHVSLYLCIHISMYLCILVFMYPCIHVSGHVSMYSCIHVSLYSRIPVSMNHFIHVSFYSCILVFMYPCIYVSLYVSMYPCISVFMYLYNHVSMYLCSVYLYLLRDLSINLKQTNSTTKYII